MNLEQIITRTLEDVQNLERQIRSLLKTMEVSESLDKAPELPLPEPKSMKEGERAVDVRMEWSGPERPRRRSRGKTTTVPDTSTRASDEGGGMCPETEGGGELSALDVMELCIRENILKYEVVEDSLFFVPVLDRCVLGMALRNVTNTKLRMPSLSLNLLPSKLISQRLERSFLYNAQISVKDSNQVQGTFAACNGYMGEGWIMSGSEVQVLATFNCPSHLVGGDNKLSLLVSVFLDRKQLWSRKLHVGSLHFNAASIDSTFKSHHATILAALGCHHQTFKMERILSQDGKTPKQSLEQFLLPMGYECIMSKSNGIDSLIEVYASNQPSMYWGSYFKIETSSRKPSVIRCLISARTREQMRLIYEQFQSWLRRKIQRERKYGTGSGPRIVALGPNISTSIINRIDSEIQLILRLQDVKSILNSEGTRMRSQRRKQDLSYSEMGSIDSNWIHEYCLCVAKTDGIFVEKMKNKGN